MSRATAIIINEDNSHYYFSRGKESASMERLRELPAHYCRGMVGEVFYNPNAQRCSVDGFCLEPIWHGAEQRDGTWYFNGKKQEDYGFNNWLEGAYELHRQGIDPYTVWLDETRKLGRRAFISIRMNDAHCVNDTDSALHGSLWRNHPEWRLDATGICSWEFKAMDYAVPEVRNLYLTFAREVLERYDCDGIELDWMRFGHNFQPKDAATGRDILTQFHRDIRKAADEAAARLGHPLDVYARVPANPTDAFAIGYDVKRWVDEGLVQGVIVSPFLRVDTDMPLALWRRMLGPDIVLCAGLDLNVEPYLGVGSVKEDFALLAGQAANYLHQGADRIYLFNMMDSGTCLPDAEEYNRALDAIGSLDAAAAAHRRHPVTFQDFWAFGHGNGFVGRVPSVLPVTLHWLEYGGFRIAVGPKPEKGRKCRLVIGGDNDEIGNMTAWLNNVKLTPTETFVNADSLPEPYPPCAARLAAFDCTDAVAEGDNFIVLRYEGNATTTITWVELEIL